MKYILSITVLFLTLSLNAYSVYEKYTGNDNFAFSARQLAMGSSGVANGTDAMDMALNPANLTFMPATFSLQAGLHLTSDDETRTTPVYDSFDAWVTDAAYASNVNMFDDYSVGLAYKTKYNGFLYAVGFNMRPLKNYDNDYEEQVRDDGNTDNDDYPQILAKNYIDGEGRLHAYGLNFSVGKELDLPYLQQLSFGLELAILDGELRNTKKIRWSEYAKNAVGNGILPDSTYKIDLDQKGFMPIFGLNAQIMPSLNIGFTFTPETDLDNSGKVGDERAKDAYYYREVKRITTKVNGVNYVTDYKYANSVSYSDIVLPTSFKAGVTYRPRNIFSTTFNFDVEYIDHKSMIENASNDLNYYVGVEHIVANSFPLRFGFSYQTSYSVKAENANMILQLPVEGGVITTSKPVTYYVTEKISIPAFSVGTSISIMKNLSLDIAAEYSYRTFEEKDLFRDGYFDDRAWINPNDPSSVTSALWTQYKTPKDRADDDTVEEDFIKILTTLTYRW